MSGDNGAVTFIRFTYLGEKVNDESVMVRTMMWKVEDGRQDQEMKSWMMEKAVCL